MPPIKQYVNLPTGVTNSQGNTRQLRVTPNTVPNIAPGDSVEWWVEPQGGNMDTQFIRPNVRPAQMMQHSITALSAGNFNNRITFPQVGGDQYIVNVSKRGDRSNPLATEPFQTWRKLYYTVFYMGNDALNMFNTLEARFKSAFAEGFIELENVAKVATLTEMVRVDVTSQAFLGRPAMHFLGGAPNGVVDLRPAGVGTLSSKPFHVAILVVPDLYKLNGETINVAATRAVAGLTTVQYRLHRAPGPSFVSANITWTGHAASDEKARFAVTSATDNLSRFNWDLSALPGLTNWLVNPAHTFSMNLTLVRERTVMGYSLRNFCVVRTVDGITDVLQTFTHEVGHGVGQVVRRESRWDAGTGNPIADDLNPNWHDDTYGGRGNHCTTAAQLVASVAADGLTSGQKYAYSGAGTLCTMFRAGESHVDADGKFCPNCVPRLKRADVSSTTMGVAPRLWTYIG